MYGIICTEEIWKEITCCNIMPGYYISTFGRVKDLNGNIKKQHFNTGYPAVSLKQISGKSKSFYIHRLVGFTFLFNDDPINKNQIDHIDTCKTNNKVENLEWVTQSENIKREINNLKRQYKEMGISGGFRFIHTEDQIHIICKAVKNGYSYGEALEMAGMENNTRNRSNVCDIITGRVWKDISSQYFTF